MIRFSLSHQVDDVLLAVASLSRLYQLEDATRGCGNFAGSRHIPTVAAVRDSDEHIIRYSQDTHLRPPRPPLLTGSMPAPSETSARTRFSVPRSTSSKRSLLSVAKPRAMSNASNISGCTTVKPSSSPTSTTLTTSTVSATSNGRSLNATPVPLPAALSKRTSVSVSSAASQSSHRLPVPVTKRVDPTSPSPVKGRRTSLIGPPSAFPRSLSSVSVSQRPGGVQATPSRTRVMSEAPTPSRNAQTHVHSSSQSHSNSLSTGPSALSPPIDLAPSTSAKRMHKSISMSGENTPSRVRAMSTSVASGVPFNVKHATPTRTNVQGTPAKSPAQTTPGRSPAHGTPAKSPGQVTPAKSPKITKTPERSPQAQLTPSKPHLLPVEKGQRKGSIASVVGGGRHESVALLSESLLVRTMNLNGPASVVNGSGPLSQVNGGASTLVNANEGYPWDDRDADDITLEMITDIGEETGDEEVSSFSSPLSALFFVL